MPCRACAESLLERNCKEGEEENWYSSFDAQVYLEQIEADLEVELTQQNPVWQWIDVVCFVSHSRGRGKRARRNLRPVILLRIRNGLKRWMFWDGEDRNTKSLKWDELAIEIFGEEFCLSLSTRGIHPDDYLREEIKKLLR